MQMLRQGKRLEAMQTLKENSQERDIVARTFLRNETFHVYQEGVVWLEQRDWDRAIQKFRQAHALESDNVEVLVRLGQALLAKRQGPPTAREAQVVLVRAIELSPREFQAKLWLGRALLDLRLWDDALLYLHQVADERPHWEWTSTWIAEAMSAKKQSPVLFLQETMRKYPMRLSALVNLAKLRADQKTVSRLLLSRWAPYREQKQDFHLRQASLGPLGLDFETPQELEARWKAGLNPVSKVE